MWAPHDVLTRLLKQYETRPLIIKIENKNKFTGENTVNEKSICMLCMLFTAHKNGKITITQCLSVELDSIIGPT